MKKYLLIFLALCCFSSPILAWNSNGHKVIAQIAYDNLTPTAQEKVNKLVIVVGHYYGIKYFVNGAPWADWLKVNNVTAYNTWHYINQPYMPKPCAACQVQAVQATNAVWAINQCLQVLETADSAQYPEESAFNKSMFLLFLEHIVGDLHQPLHSINYYSNAFPEGDRGGTLYPIQAADANNLHAYWDEGAGLFPTKSLSSSKIKNLASMIEQAYPKSSLQAEAGDLNPQDWATAAKILAEQQAYQLAPNSKPSAAYSHAVYQMAERQAALGGYRLAAILNDFSYDSGSS